MKSRDFCKGCRRLSGRYAMICCIMLFISLPIFPFVLVGHIVVAEWRVKNEPHVNKFAPVVLAEFTDQVFSATRESDTRDTGNMSYLTVMFSGGLGNRMFQYASLTCIAHHNKMQGHLPQGCILPEVFNIPNSELALSESIFSRPGINYPKFLEKSSYIWDKRTLRLNPKLNIELLGYFQSWKYFHSCKHKVRRQLSFKTDVVKAANMYLTQAANKAGEARPTFVSIHVRRGDITQVPHIAELGYTTATRQYFLNSMEYFKSRHKNIVFVVCSNDIKWSRENLSNNNNSIYFVDSGRDEVDLCILSRCNHSIISTGSYGWWGAWLASGEVTYYKHFPKPGSPLHKSFNPWDYFLPEWIGLD
ncbi:unnamed protein product [Owenia fusiformis]|uniref:L-Fucosyltransferase n=1 Tax=Owenia fusiformis TaxID=6347 RepID=A0A8J1UQT8_OWEFU|nr:unnamed protein product [Owenia fusiformis]